MNEGGSALPPAGWYPDAFDPSARRWWDGAAWTAHVRQPEPPPVEAAVTRRQLREQDGPLTVGVPEEAPGTVAVLERPAEISSIEYARRAAGYEPLAVEPATTAHFATEPTHFGSAQTLPGWFIALSPIWFGGIDVLFGILSTLGFPGGVRTAALVPTLIAFGAILIALGRVDRNRLHARGYRPIGPAWALLPIVYLIMRTVSTGRRSAGMLVTYILVQFVYLLVLVVGVLAIFFATVDDHPITASSDEVPLQQIPEEDWPAVLTEHQRAYLLTDDGMVLGLAHVLDGTLVIDAASCAPFPYETPGAETQCMISAEGSQWFVILSLTPYAPDAAFEIVNLGPVESDGAVQS